MKLRSKAVLTAMVLTALVNPLLSTGFTTPARAVTGVTGKSRLYFGVNRGGSAGIYWKNLDGTGGATRLATTGASATDVGGLTLDPQNGYVYWTNCGAQLDRKSTRLNSSHRT